MARFTTDLVRGYPPTAVTVFYDGAHPAQVAHAARYRAALPAARRDVLFRDLARFPDALSLFGLGRGAAREGLAVIDRLGRLRIGLDARIALWREIPVYRWRARALDILGLAAFLERPVTPRAARAAAVPRTRAPLPRRHASHPA